MNLATRDYIEVRPVKAAGSARKHIDLIYDVGMHKGEDTEFYLRKGFKVIAFEADPELVEYNKRRFSEDIRKKALVIVEGAIVDKPVSQGVTFYKSSNSVWGTVDVGWAKRNEEAYGLRTNPLR